MTRRISHIKVRMRVSISESGGRWRGGGPRRTILMTRLRAAAVLSESHRKVHLWRSPQFRDIAEIRSRADANPQSSQQVEDVVSKGPSTGPPPSKSMVFLVEMTQPKVPIWLSRPPSEATINRSLERNALQICKSVAFWLTLCNICLCVLGRLFI